MEDGTVHPKVSIIIPIYNSENTLNKCLDSVIKQSIRRYEVVCINDGSTDATSEIVESYKRRYPHLIKAFNQANLGVWGARKEGIKKSKGKYICFLDSDDEVDETWAEVLYNTIMKNEADMALCGYRRIDQKSNKVLCEEMNCFGKEVISIKEVPDRLLAINTALWNKIFKRSILEQVEEINPAPRILEDMMFLLLVYRKIEKIAFNPSLLYSYYVSSETAMATLKEGDLPTIKKAMLQVRQIFLDHQVEEKLLNVVDISAFMHIGLSIAYRASYYKGAKVNHLVKDIQEYLSKYFPTWKNNSLLSFKKSVVYTHYNLKLWIVWWVYRLGALSLFLVLYKSLTKFLKIDIKW